MRSTSLKPETETYHQHPELLILGVLRALAEVALLFWCWIGLAYLKKLYCDANLLQCF